MKSIEPTFFNLVRGHGLIAMLAPLLISTSTTYMITNEIYILNFFLACIVGFSLHISMNVYNDIYDTKQGSDTLESSKNLFSGGSAYLINYPNLEQKMFFIARTGIILAFFGILGLLFVSDSELWPIFIFIFITATFLSKYYTASPIKFAYRGLGEIVVWFGFGPLAVLLGAAAQGIVIHPLIFAIMPLTGISTLIFSLSGEMVDRPYDIKAGKNGLVIRIGVKKSIVIVLLLHILLILNIAIISTLIENKGWYLFLFLMPYFLLLPKTFSFLLKGVDDRVNLVKGAKFNFNTFVVFSMMTIIGFITLAYIQ